MSTSEHTPELPYRIAVLCYIYDKQGRILMLHRAKPPNQDLYSPVGGKLETGLGESPWECARREIKEETGLDIEPGDIRLQGMVSETAYENSGHWLLFLFEVTRAVEHSELAFVEFDEGRLEWIEPEKVAELSIPDTDQRVIWPMSQSHRGGFFGVHIDCRNDPFTWTLEQEILPSS
ncbi:MAG: NUDIX hydrolase [Phycisphaerae bacterium]|nr:NUDIX hydrolase [Phycisphaerae bacterium]|tara:strand:+ start:753 stop:1283 length:531 start_codon:yes stop_codon:yes gene_type:complete